MRTTRAVTAVLTLALLVALPRVSLAQGGDGLNEARAKYEAASYEEALAILDGLDATGRSGDERAAIQHYRALCLIALDRTADAEASVEMMVRARPMAQNESDLPPRLRDLLLRVRPRVARVMVKEYYERGRDLYQHHDFAAAGEELQAAIALIDDTSLGLGGEPAYADIRLIADGFLKLAAAAASSASSPVAPASPSTGASPAAGATVAPPPAAAGSSAAATTPAPGFRLPRAINQAVPPLPRWIGSGPGRDGEIQVDVGADGLVRTAKITRSVHPAYDPVLVAAVLANWKYEPATRNGVAVPYTVTVRVVLPPH